VRGNYVGTDVTGTKNLGNNGAGVTIPQGQNNTVSGNDSDRTGPNVIMFNHGPGIHVGVASNGNKLRINRIDLNDEIGINLNTLGVSPNDPGDGDEGGNDGQNFPVLRSAQVANGTVNVQGTLNSNAFQRFTVDLYVSPACDPTGNGEGRQWFGAFIADTDANGNVSFSTSFGGGAVTPGQVVTALATSGDFITTTTPATGNTSEFSTCITATAAPATGLLSSIVDDTPDDLTPSPSGLAPDLASATVTSTGTALVFSVRYAPGTFNSASTFAQVLLDTDRNFLTGHRGTTNLCDTDASTIGSEYIVQVGTSVLVFRSRGTCNSFDVLSGASVNVTGVVNATQDGYDITIPLDAIGGSSALNYKFLTFPSGSGVADVMPNRNTPAATTVGGGGGF